MKYVTYIQFGSVDYVLPEINDAKIYPKVAAS